MGSFAFPTPLASLWHSFALESTVTADRLRLLIAQGICDADGDLVRAGLELADRKIDAFVRAVGDLICGEHALPVLRGIDAIGEIREGAGAVEGVELDVDLVAAARGGHLADERGGVVDDDRVADPAGRAAGARRVG